MTSGFRVRFGVEIDPPGDREVDTQPFFNARNDTCNSR
jgi:hypothetical protein